MRPNRTNPSAKAREHHWDALRALLMLLGIPYHVAMSYRANAGWIVNSGEGDLALDRLAQTIHVFRMQAFFLIAGYFAALLLARRAPGEWLRGRFIRLGIPFVVALLTLNPVMNLLCELSNFSWPDALASMGENSSTSGGYWMRHLWFIHVLLYLCAGAALLVHLVPRLGKAELPARADAVLARHVTLALLATAAVLGVWQGAAIEWFYIAGLNTNLYQEILRLDQLIEFTPWFALGFLVARAPALRQAIYRFSPAMLAFGMIALAADLGVRDQLWPPYARFLDTLAAVALTQSLIAAIRRIADRPSDRVRALVDASFVIYLVHMPIIIALVIAAKPLAMPLALKAPLVMVLTMAMSWAAWLVVRKSPALRLLFDGVFITPFSGTHDRARRLSASG